MIPEAALWACLSLAPAPEQGSDPDIDPGPEDEVSQDAESTEDPLDQLLAEGGSAYQLGDFDRAIEAFEAAYALSPEHPLLYNLALAHLRRYDGSGAIEDLQRARSLLTNFGIALLADPSLGDPTNVNELIQQTEEQIAAHERADEEREAALREDKLRIEAEAEAAAAEDCPVVDVSEPADTGRGRAIGAVLMGSGSLSLAAGVAVIAGFAVKGREFGSDLAVLEAERRDLGCDGLADSAQCQTYDEAIEATITNGRRANIFAGTIGGTLTALGAAGLVAGAIVFTRSGSGTKQRARLRVAPSLTGIVVHGRF